MQAAIARDGLLPEVFAVIDPIKKVPVKSAYIHMLVLGFITFFCDLETLAKVISLENLVSYGSINACCLALRY